MLRIIRLFSVLTQIMTHRASQVLLTLVKGIGAVCMSMIPTILLIYCYSNFMRVMMAHDFDDADLQKTAKNYFGSLPVTMLTLCEFMFGNFAFSEVITFPLVKSGVSPLASFMWISFVILVQILLLTSSQPRLYTWLSEWDDIMMTAELKNVW